MRHSVKWVFPQYPAVWDLRRGWNTNLICLPRLSLEAAGTWRSGAIRNVSGWLSSKQTSALASGQLGFRAPQDCPFAHCSSVFMVHILQILKSLPAYTSFCLFFPSCGKCVFSYVYYSIGGCCCFFLRFIFLSTIFSLDKWQQKNTCLLLTGAA